MGRYAPVQPVTIPTMCSMPGCTTPSFTTAIGSALGPSKTWMRLCRRHAILRGIIQPDHGEMDDAQCLLESIPH